MLFLSYIILHCCYYGYSYGQEFYQFCLKMPTYSTDNLKIKRTEALKNLIAQKQETLVECRQTNNK